VQDQVARGLLGLVALFCSGYPFITDTMIADKTPDQDGDGYNASIDCDDADAAVNPGAVVCWSKDNERQVSDAP
jgi:hypothetical protein